MIEGEGSPKLNGESIKFRIPSIPPSMNDIYWHIKGHFGEYKYVLKNEVRLWKTQTKEFIPPFASINPTRPFYFNWSAVNNWYYKNGKPLRLDLTNLEKVLIDAVCEKLGVGDELIWDTRRTKIHSPTQSFIDAEIGYYQE